MRRKEEESSDLPREEAKTLTEAEAGGEERAGGVAQCALGNRAEAPTARRPVGRWWTAAERRLERTTERWQAGGGRAAERPLGAPCVMRHLAKQRTDGAREARIKKSHPKMNSLQTSLVYLAADQREAFQHCPAAQLHQHEHLHRKKPAVNWLYIKLSNLSFSVYVRGEKQ